MTVQQELDVSLPLDLVSITLFLSALCIFFHPSPHSFLVSSPFCCTALTTVKTVCSCERVHVCAVVILSQPVSRCQGAGGLQMVVIPLRQRQEEKDSDRGRREKRNGACEEQKETERE